MKIDVYRAKKFPDYWSNNYILVPKEYNVEELPSELKEQTGDLIFEKTIDLNPGDTRIALNTDEALSNLNEKKFYLQYVQIKPAMSVSG